MGAGKKDKRGKKEVVDLRSYSTNAPKLSLDSYQDANNVDETATEAAKASSLSELAQHRAKQHRAAEFENFRTLPIGRIRAVVAPNMKGPYVVFVKNLLTNIPEADLRGAFATDKLPADALLSARIVTKDGVSTFAYITFNSRDALKEALLLDGTMVRDRKMHVDVATPDQIERISEKKCVPPEMEGPFVAFVNKLSTTLSEEDVRKAFTTKHLPAEALLTVKIAKKEGSAVTFGFLTFDTTLHLEEALQLNDKLIGGRRILITIAAPPKAKQPPGNKEGTSPSAASSSTSPLDPKEAS